MKPFTCLKAIPQSFYSAPLYREVARNWGASAFFYLLMLLTLCSIFWTVVIQVHVNKSLETDLGPSIDKIMVEVPLTTLNDDGTLTTPENKPYLVHDLQNKKVILVIDTSGKYTTVENQPFDILITKTQYIARKSSNEIQIRDIPKGYHFVFHPEKARGYAEYWGERLWLILFPAFIFCGFIWRITQAAVYAILGKLFALMMGVELSYFTIFTLTMVSLTPSILLDLILVGFLTLGFPGIGLAYFILQMIYLAYAINANKTSKEVVI